MVKVYVFDCDGVLADGSHRLHYIAGPKKDWNSFYKACVDDKPINWVIDNLLKPQLYVSDGADSGLVVILTGRSAVVEQETKDWLKRFGILGGYTLIMRPIGNYEPDYQLKPRLLKDWMNGKDYEVQFIVEDRNQVVKMWRQLGYNVLQPADGNF